MIERALAFLIPRYVGGPARSWIYTSFAIVGLRAARRVVGRKEIIDIGKVGAGQRIEIEHLDIDHKRQIKQLKGEAKATKRDEKAAAKAEKAAKREEKAAKREARALRRAEKAAEKAAKREAKGR